MKFQITLEAFVHIYLSKIERRGQLSENERKSISIEKTFPRKKKHEISQSWVDSKAGRGTFFCLLMRVKVSDDDSEQKLKLTKPIQDASFFNLDKLWWFENKNVIVVLQNNLYSQCFLC